MRSRRLFTSVYPYHYWQAVITHAPQLSIPGIGGILQSHGYRVAFIHSGNLADSEQSYLRTHGFPEVYDKGDLPGFPRGHSLGRWHYDFRTRDAKLVPAAMNWIGTDRAKPFFLALWTDDTHSPYTPPAVKSFGVPDGDLNRYLGAVEETDANVAELERELAARGLLDDTLVVVTGDHGEQFGQHGKAGHGFSLYEEEVRVPLIIANPRLFPHGEKIDSDRAADRYRPDPASSAGIRCSCSSGKEKTCSMEEPSAAPICSTTITSVWSRAIASIFTMRVQRMPKSTI